MILIYSSGITRRLEYTFRLIFEEILRMEAGFTDSLPEYTASSGPKINYSHQNNQSGLFLKPGTLLFKTGIECPEPDTVDFRGEKYFFRTSGDSFLPFDPFAATFFLVSRLEEYSDRNPDQYGRFRHENSILFKNGLLRKPVVNIWARMVAAALKEKYPSLFVPEPEFKFLATIDIDSAWAYRNKGFFRNAGGFVRDLAKSTFKEAISRVSVLTGFKTDPFDTFDFIDESLTGRESQAIFFILLGDHSKFNKNISHKNHEFRELIGRISKKYRTGIHPSFPGNLSHGFILVRTGMQRLKAITGKEVLLSRQHYLYLRFPETYQTLIRAGITADYTMGYAGECGFRAGICTPFQYYDVLNEQVTQLSVFPFQVMDVSLKDYLGLTPDKAWEVIESLMDEVKMAGGTFVGIWHNETISDEDPWKGYRAVFTRMLKTGFKWADESM